MVNGRHNALQAKNCSGPGLDYSGSDGIKADAHRPLRPLKCNEPYPYLLMGSEVFGF